MTDDGWNLTRLQRDLAVIQGALLAAAATAGLVLGVIVTSAWEHVKRPDIQT